MKLSVCKFQAVACLGFVFATVSTPATAQTVNRDDILYVMPSYSGFSSASDAALTTEVNSLRSRLGPEGPYVKLGFTLFLGFDMTDWNVDITSPTAMATAISGTVATIDGFIARAEAHGVPIALNVLTPAREGYDGAQTGSEGEDVRSMQWYADNVVARGWWSTSRYNRKKMIVQEAYARALGKVLADRMHRYPDVLVAASGDGEVELAIPRSGASTMFADYSPFAIAEFRDWLRNGGLYALGKEFAGQGYANASRYAGDASPGIDSNADGHTLNGDFGTSFATWDLLHFNWSIEDACTPLCASQTVIPLSTYEAAGFNKLPGTVAGGFDAPRVSILTIGGNVWWDVWVAFKVLMLQRHNTEYAKWITTSIDDVTIGADTATGATVPTQRWFSYQIPADYLFGSSPAAPNDRWHTSMSSLSTADISPYGGMGITAFNVDFATLPAPCGATFLGVVKTLKNAAPAISARGARWGLIEWHPGQRPECTANSFQGGFSPDATIYQEEMTYIKQYGPSYVAPFLWDAVGKNQIKDTPFETALKTLVAELKNGKTPDPRIATDTANGATVALPLTLTGSAVDLGKVTGTSHGTGIDLVTMTIAPQSGGSATTLTVTYGVTRADTVANHGAQFAKAGFTTTIPKSFAAGLYTITITARSTVGAAATSTTTMTLNVTYNVTSTPAGLQFGGTRPSSGAAANVFTAPQVLTPTYGGNVTPSYTAAANTQWLKVVSGPSTGQFTVSIQNPENIIATSTSLVGGVVITGTSGGATVGTATVPVTLSIIEGSNSPLPFGSFDTPASSTTPTSGAIQVSGWALDDVGIQSVQIWRDLAAGETTQVFTGPAGHLGNGKIYVADVSFVEGARPDIAAQFPNNPNAHKAGWGYLMLSQGLFNQGNGTFTLYAFAYDVDGRGKSLGSKTIFISNSTAVKPFGNIDQPANGGTLSTADSPVAHFNFGWALTPGATPPCTIPTTLSTDSLADPLRGVYVAFDSGTLRRVGYGGSTNVRTDIQAAFPGYTNTNGAGGAYFIDITTLTNGLHQLGWYVVDDCGRAEGIGSRFVNIVKTSGTVLTAAPMMLSLAPAGNQPVDVVRSSGEIEQVVANSDGVRVITIPGNERVEVRLPSNGNSGYVGYQIANGERRALPLGSSLSPADGVFYWEPAAGFLGAYNLEFVGDGPEGRTTTRVRVVVGPAMRLTLDTPKPGAVVGASFPVGGWVFDLAGEKGGVDAVDVWAYRVTPGAAIDSRPTYLGSAIYGGSRPDVAAVYGSDFKDTAFDLTASGLAPGTYDVVVFARSAATGTFDTVQSVRIVVR